MDRPNSRQQWNLPSWRVQGVRSHFVLLLALLIALSNPLACLIHCWVHNHAAPLRAAPATMGGYAHAHHTAHKAAAAPLVEQPNQTQDTSPATFCRSDHQTPSPFTVAVLLPLVLFTFWVAPGFSLPVNLLFLLLPAHPPPRRPPRFASIPTSVL
jgi:hypothetical protein